MEKLWETRGWQSQRWKKTPGAASSRLWARNALVDSVKIDRVLGARVVGYLAHYRVPGLRDAILVRR